MRIVAPVVEGASPEPGEGDGTEETLRTFDLVGVLSELSPVHREVLFLAYFEGLTQREISHHTGVPLGTVKSRTTAALRAARERMLSSEAPNDRQDNAPKQGRSEDG